MALLLLTIRHATLGRPYDTSCITDVRRHRMLYRTAGGAILHLPYFHMPVGRFLLYLIEIVLSVIVSQRLSLAFIESIQLIAP